METLAIIEMASGVVSAVISMAKAGMDAAAAYKAVTQHTTDRLATGSIPTYADLMVLADKTIKDEADLQADAERRRLAGQ